MSDARRATVVRARGGTVSKRLVGVLGTVVWVAIAVSSGSAATSGSAPTSIPSARAALAAKGCTPKPTTASPWWQRLSGMLDRSAMSECQPRGPLARAVQKSAKASSAHRNASPRAMRPAADSPRAASPAAATQAFAAAPVANGFGPAIPAAPPTENPPPPAAPAPQASVSENQEPENQEPDVSAPARAPEPAPASAAAPAPQSAPIVQAARTAAAVGEGDHSSGLLVLAAALLIIVGPVLGITRLLSVLMARIERRRARRAPTAPVRQMTGETPEGSLFDRPRSEKHRLA
jgi:hypothetical protein